MQTISKPCMAAMHAACKGTRATCACDVCHLGPCVRCAADNLGRIFEGLCANCKRDDAKAAPPPATLCDGCGAAGAYRNPATRGSEFLCAACHVAADGRVPVAAVHVAPCAGKDISDPAHNWQSMWGSRFQCRCGMKKYDAKLRDERRRME